MVNYYLSRFLPKISSLAEPLRRIATNDATDGCEKILVGHIEAFAVNDCFQALHQYNIDLWFVPGSLMYIADFLSWLHLPVSEDLKQGVVYSLRKADRYVSKVFDQLNLIEDLPKTDERVRANLEKTLKDVDMCLLAHYIVHGFPQNVVDAPAEIAQYSRYQEELSTQNWLIFKGNRVPKK